MKEFNQIPPAISHKQLKTLLNAAKPDVKTSQGSTQDISEEKELFQGLLEDWHQSSKKLLQKLSKKEDSIFEERSAKAHMALGALEAHLNMAIHAFKASKQNE